MHNETKNLSHCFVRNKELLYYEVLNLVNERTSVINVIKFVRLKISRKVEGMMIYLHSDFTTSLMEATSSKIKLK